MTQWRNHPYKQPIITTIAIIVVLLLAIALANAVTAIPGKEPCVETGMKEKIRERMLEGFDEGLRTHTRRMYDIWIQDDTDQPKRAINGMRSGTWAYVRGRNAALRWEPLICKGG